jgi:DNA-binding protein Fis
MLLDALAREPHNQSRAADLLGITRFALKRLMTRYADRLPTGVAGRVAPEED